MIYQLLRIKISCLLILISYSSIAQNCFNSDFETGEISGYTTFIGEISSEGNITINTAIQDPERHKVVSILDGYDAIAMQFCDDNEFLPVVPPSGGIYAMRLGNSNNGAEAERILLRFTVTNDNAFFLLRYAVLLNDPSHEEHEQPRFRLSITNTDGIEYPCGRYEVVAAPNIENFENCKDDWKVRPWTNIGIELLSYLGEEIIIEMMTTDCARGGHAGYAYLDATCKPLEIELFNNCTDTSTALMRITPGFDKYLWSTGDTTSEINIPNPVIGDIYYVTVTSSTGCQLVLNDTIPPYEVAVPPTFSASTSTAYCKDTSFWFRPEGNNLEQIYSIEHQTFIDSIFINTLISNEFTFVAFSDSGCAFDTVTHYFGGLPRVIESIIDPLCYDSNDGSVSISPVGNSNSHEYLWSTGSSDSLLTNLTRGSYQVTITDEPGCTHVENYILDSPEKLTSTITIYEYLCQDTYGSAFILSDGGVVPYNFSYDNGFSFNANGYYEQYVEGTNTILVKDGNECLDTITITFDPPSNPIIEDIDIHIDSCGTNNSSLQINSVGNAELPVTYSINNSPFSDHNVFENLTDGIYLIEVKDANGCLGTTEIIIPLIQNISITETIVENSTCELSNGSVQIITNVTNGLSYAINNGIFQTSNRFTSLAEGQYMAYIKYFNNCMDSLVFTIGGTSLPEIESVDIEYIPCSDGQNEIEINAISGTPPYLYKLDDQSWQSENIFNELETGWHEISINDEMNCINTLSFLVEQIDSFTYAIETLEQPMCGEETGIIQINITGGKGFRQIRYLGDLYPDQFVFENLTDGLHSFILLDQGGCRKELDIILLADCQVYVPNSFSPNADDVNDLLTINIAQNATATLNTFNIFDRWGNKLHSVNDLEITNSETPLWNGTFKNEACPAGIYVYTLELEMYNGTVIQRNGDITIHK